MNSYSVKVPLCPLGFVQPCFFEILIELILNPLTLVSPIPNRWTISSLPYVHFSTIMEEIATLVDYIKNAVEFTVVLPASLVVLQNEYIIYIYIYIFQDRICILPT